MNEGREAFSKSHVTFNNLPPNDGTLPVGPKRNYKSGKELFTHDLDDRDLQQIIDESELDDNLVPFPNDYAHYNTLVQKQRTPKRVQRPRPKIHPNQSFFTSPWFKGFIGMLLAVTFAGGLSWIWKIFLRPILFKSKKPNSLMIVEKKLAQSDDPIQNEDKVTASNQEIAKQLRDETTLIREQLSSLRNLIANQSTSVNNNNPDIQMLRYELSDMKTKLDHLRSQISVERYEQRPSVNEPVNTLTELRIEIAQVKGLLTALSNSIAQYSVSPPISQYYRASQQVSNGITSSTLVSTAPSNVAQPTVQDRIAESSTTYHAQSTFATPNAGLDDIGKPYVIQEPSDMEQKRGQSPTLQQISDRYNKTVLTDAESTEQVNNQNIETVIVDSNTVKNEAVNDDAFDDVIFEGGPPSFDALFDTARQFSNSSVSYNNPYMSNLLETDFSNETSATQQDIEMLSMKQTVQEEPKFKKSKLFSFIDDISSGKVSLDGKSKEKKKKKKRIATKVTKKTEQMNTFDEIYNTKESTTPQITENKEEEVAVVNAVNESQVFTDISKPIAPGIMEQVLDKQPAIAITEKNFAAYDFDNDENFQKKLQFVLNSGGLDRLLTDSQRHVALLKLKAKYFKRDVDPSFDFDKYCSDNNIVASIEETHISADKISEAGTENNSSTSNTTASQEPSPQLEPVTDITQQSRRDKELEVVTNDAPLSPTAAHDPPPYPKSFTKVWQQLQEGEEPKGIKKIDDKPKNPNRKPTPSVKPKKEKPWMRKKNADSSSPQDNGQDALFANSQNESKPETGDVPHESSNE